MPLKIEPAVLKGIWQNITGQRRKQLGLLSLLMLLTSVAEVASISAVIPFLGVLSSPEMVFDHDLAQPLVKFAELTTPEQLFLPLTIVFCAAALIAGTMRIALHWGQTRLANAIGADLSYQIYRRTLFQPYAVHVSRNSSEVIAGISSKASQVVSAAITPVMTIISSAMMMSMVLTTLIIIEPVMSISVILGFGVIYTIFIRIVKRRLLKNSQKISRQSNYLIKVLQEGLGGIRDVLIDGAQAIYCEAFRAADLSLRRASANNQFMGQSPRYGVESLGMVLIAGVAYSFASGQGGLSSVLPMLGALAIGAQRMLPMLQQAYAALTNFLGAQAALRDALELLEQPMPKYAEGPTSEKITFHDEIRISQLDFRYRNDAPLVLKGINLKIGKGERIGFIGTTGSGKSTLLDVIMGLLHPSDGKIFVDGVEISGQNHRGWQSHIAHIPQTIFLSDATVSENIAFGIPVEKIDYQRVQQAAQQAQIAETVESWELKYQTIVGERGVRLSGGQRQRIGIARALYKCSDVLIFDEATSALDSKTENAVMQAIDSIENNITMLMVAHRVSTLRSCDLIVELEQGKIKRSGSYDEIIGRGFI